MESTRSKNKGIWKGKGDERGAEKSNKPETKD
jgi:hypothetical protein